MKPSQDEIEEALEGDSCGCWDGCKCGGGDKVIVLRAAYRSKCAELGKSEESLKIKHFSSCSDGSCDDTCGVAYANHFDCWLKERTHSIRAKLAASEKERDEAIARSGKAISEGLIHGVAYDEVKAKLTAAEAKIERMRGRVVAILNAAKSAGSFRPIDLEELCEYALSDTPKEGG